MMGWMGRVRPIVWGRRGSGRRLGQWSVNDGRREGLDLRGVVDPEPEEPLGGLGRSIAPVGLDRHPEGQQLLSTGHVLVGSLDDSVDQGRRVD